MSLGHFHFSKLLLIPIHQLLVVPWIQFLPLLFTESVWKSTNSTPFPKCLITNDKITFRCRGIKGHNLMISSEKPVQHYYSEINLNQHNIHLNKKQKALYWSPWG